MAADEERSKTVETSSGAPSPTPPPAPVPSREAYRRSPGGRSGSGSGSNDEWFEKVISINRVAKVHKGGKRMAFSALVVVGDRKGRVGCALGKANEVADAIRKGLIRARRDLIEVPLQGATIPFEVIGHFGAGKVMLKPASEGTGVIAGGPVRSICEAAGIRDILAKCLKSDNPINVVWAAVDGLQQLRNPIALRSLRVVEGGA